jgi:hypothetical protein
VWDSAPIAGRSFDVEPKIGSGKSTAEQNGNSGTRTEASASMNGNHDLGSSPSTIPREIDWSRVSPRGMAIVRLVATSASQGWTATEIAQGLATTRPWVLNRLAELRSELEGLGG